MWEFHAHHEWVALLFKMYILGEKPTVRCETAEVWDISFISVTYLNIDDINIHKLCKTISTFILSYLSYKINRFLHIVTYNGHKIFMMICDKYNYWNNYNQLQGICNNVLLCKYTVIENEWASAKLLQNSVPSLIIMKKIVTGIASVHSHKTFREFLSVI